MAGMNEHVRKIQELSEEYQNSVKEAWERYNINLANAMEEFMFGDGVNAAPAEPRRG